MRKLNVLVVDDHKEAFICVQSNLGESCNLSYANSEQMGLQKIKNEEFDVAIIDLTLTRKPNEFSGLNLITPSLEKDIYTIVYSATENSKIKEKVSDLGANAFFSKQDKTTFDKIKKEVLEFIINRDEFIENSFFKGLYRTNDPIFLREIKQLIPLLDTDTPVFIDGPTGSGKTEIARRIHDLSKREGSFEVIDCGAIDNELILSELFGHKKGAFTSAIAERKGKLKLADNGTLFLDEISRLSVNNQKKLLKALDEKKFTPVGSEKTESSNFRLITATSSNVNKMVQDQEFILDLYHRIQGKVIHVKPLCERQSDILPLIKHFLKKRIQFTEDASNYLLNYLWPGNVRELRFFVEKLNQSNEINQSIGLNYIKQSLGAEIAKSGQKDKFLSEIYDWITIDGFNEVISEIRKYAILRSANETDTPSSASVKIKMSKCMFFTNYNKLKK